MQTSDPIQDALLDEKTYTSYQREQGRIYNLHPKLFPVAAPVDLPDTNPTRHNLFAGPPPATHATPTPAEQAAELAVVYGVRAQYVTLPEAEDAAATAARAALDARRLARRAEIAKKYGVSDDRLDTIPLSWLDE